MTIAVIKIWRYALKAAVLVYVLMAGGVAVLGVGLLMGVVGRLIFEDELQQTARSPDRRFIARHYLNLNYEGQDFADGQDFVQLDVHPDWFGGADRERAVFAAHCIATDLDPLLAWRGDTLWISCRVRECENISRRERQWGRTSIRYRFDGVAMQGRTHCASDSALGN